MTTPYLYSRDWPLSGRLWETFVWLILVAVLSIVAREALGAEPARAERVVKVAQPAQPALGTEVDALFDDVAAAEDPALEEHVARGSLTAGELALVIVFLILLFPVGIILLIIFLIDSDD